MAHDRVTCREADPGDMPAVRALFQEYASGLGIDLSFQGFGEELAGLPGRYAGPAGALLLAEVGGRICGCVALRPIDATTCEMKRLYVQERARGMGAGRELARRILETAREKGYARMRLDTLASMGAAQALYAELGFRQIPPYTYNPVPGTLYMEKTLTE
jgi:ribosomal protein S18 acetylase RimI-like enzyme